MDKLDLETKTVSIHLCSSAMMQLHHFQKAQEVLPEGTL